MKKHDKFINQHLKTYGKHKLSRKTKKYFKYQIKNNIIPSLQQLILWKRVDQLPKCKWCSGRGYERVDFYDTGYNCPDCEGKGVVGWYKKNDKYYNEDNEEIIFN